MMNDDTGLNVMTDMEEKCIKYLAEAWNVYVAIEQNEGKQHPNDIMEFHRGIHQCQQIIAMRIARKVEPSIFPMK